MPTVTTSAGLSALLTEMFGELVDVDAVVAKMGPDPSSVHVNGLLPTPVRRRRKVAKKESTGRQVAEGVGLGATAIGTGYGVKELAHEVPKAYPGSRGARLAMASRRAGNDLVPPAARKLMARPRARVGIAAALLGGDATATVLLGHRPREVEKAMVPLEALRAGRLKSMKQTFRPALASHVGAPMNQLVDSTNRAVKNAPAVVKAPVTPKPAVSAGQAMEQGQTARRTLAEMLGTTTGKVAVGGAAATGYAVKGRRDRSSAEQAYYGKADEVTFHGTFAKFDEDKRRAYGWASVVELNGEPVVDRQGDYIGLDDIEEAAYTYVRKSRVAGDMHRRTVDDEPFKAGELIESVVFTKDKCQAMGLPMSLAGRWWMGVQVEDEATWQEVKKGARTGFSIHGKGLRKDVSYDEILAG
jgi:hypothetical protein